MLTNENKHTKEENKNNVPSIDNSSPENKKSNSMKNILNQLINDHDDLMMFTQKAARNNQIKMDTIFTTLTTDALNQIKHTYSDHNAYTFAEEINNADMLHTITTELVREWKPEVEYAEINEWSKKTGLINKINMKSYQEFYGHENMDVAIYHGTIAHIMKNTLTTYAQWI